MQPTLFDTGRRTPGQRPRDRWSTMDLALHTAKALKLSLATVTRRRNGSVSTFHVWRPDGSVARVSDHRLPRWMHDRRRAAGRTADLFLPRHRRVSETRIRRALILIGAGRPRTARIRDALS